eukprot:jgi/Tetstr1/420938/TSEL_011999.t1
MTFATSRQSRHFLEDVDKEISDRNKLWVPEMEAWLGRHFKPDSIAAHTHQLLLNNHELQVDIVIGCETDVEQSGAGLGEPLATIHEDEHGQEEEEEEEEKKEEEEEEGPITVGGVREWHNDYEMRRGIQQIKNKRFTKSTNTCQPCQGSSAPRTVLVDNRYYQVVAATR